MIFIILLVIFVFISAVVFFSNYPLTIRYENLGGDIKIAHISDLHKRKFGRENNRLISRISAEAPDIIIISGDIVSRSETDFSVIISTLRHFRSIAPVYMCNGNHEQSMHEDKKKKFFDELDKIGVVLLRNASSTIEIKNRKFVIFGLEESYNIYKKNGSYRNLEKIDVNKLNSLLGKCPKDEVLLLAHNPFFGEAYSQWGADYTFSGHVHGGAVRIFGMGILSPERKFFPRCSKGVYTYCKMKLLVSAGLGKLRLFNPPEIVIYNL